MPSLSNHSPPFLSATWRQVQVIKPEPDAGNEHVAADEEYGSDEWEPEEVRDAVVIGKAGGPLC